MQNKTPLFLADLSDEDTKQGKTDPSGVLTESNEQSAGMENEEGFFTLDYSLFDIIPTPTDPSTDATSPSSCSKPATSISNRDIPHEVRPPPDKHDPKQVGNQGFLTSSNSSSTFSMAAASKNTVYSLNYRTNKASSSTLATQPDALENSNNASMVMDDTGVPDNNDLAELEAWLLSDAVIITD